MKYAPLLFLLLTLVGFNIGDQTGGILVTIGAFVLIVWLSSLRSNPVKRRDYDSFGGE